MTSPPNPTVSVVIPLYNKADVLARTLDSVRSQEFRDFEAIVVDDGSTDGSGDIAREFCAGSDGRFQYVHQERAGAGAARNRGMRLAHGRLVALLDADDVWDAEKLLRQVRFMNDHPGVEWCATNYLIARGSQAEAVSAVPDSGWATGDGWIVVHWLEAMADSDISTQTSGVMLRRSLIERVGEFDETIVSGQDFDYWLRIAEIAPQCGYGLRPSYTYSRRSHYSITSGEKDKYSTKVPMLVRYIRRSIEEGRPPAYSRFVRQVVERIVRHSLVDGRPDAARALLRNFPTSWRTARYAAYRLLTYFPEGVLRRLKRPAAGRAAGSSSGGEE